MVGKCWGGECNVLTLVNWELHRTPWTLGYYWQLIIRLSSLPYCSVDGGEKEREIYILFSVLATDLASPARRTIAQYQDTRPITLLFCCTLSTNINFLQIYHPSR